MSKRLDLSELKAEYEQGVSLSELAEQYGVSISTLKKTCAREKWVKGEKPKEKAARRITKRVEVITGTGTEAEPEPEHTLTRLEELVSRLMDKIELGISLTPADNVQALKQLTGALKDLSSIRGANKDELDREEQRARIEKLRADVRQATAGTEAENALRVVFVNTDGAEI